MMKVVSRAPALPAFSLQALPPGTRLGVAVSGGADSVALLRLAHTLAGRQGWTVRVLHVQHGLRGEASLADARFVAALAAELSLDYDLDHDTIQADAAALARERWIGVETAGRLLRYGWFRRLLAGNQSGQALDAIATGHTLDDQAETVLAKLLRGAWTAGLAGIYPTVAARDLPGDLAAQAYPAQERPAQGVLVRPLLGTRRDELRSWLAAIGQPWREDASNRDLEFTRNRIRHQLLPALVEFNPQVAEQLAHIGVLAREDEIYWQAELDRLLPGLLLPGRPVRGGGRAASTLPGERSLAIEVERLRALKPALARRVLRAAAARLGPAPGPGLGPGLGLELPFAETARALALLAGPVGSTARREQLTAELRVERTPRELRFVYSETQGSTTQAGTQAGLPVQAVSIPVPGEGEGFGVRLRIEPAPDWVPEAAPQPAATLRAARPGDRVRLRYSSGAPKRVKEVLERMGVPAPDRAGWPVLAWRGEIVWLRGAVLEPTPLSSRLAISVDPVSEITAAGPLPATP